MDNDKPTNCPHKPHIENILIDGFECERAGTAVKVCGVKGNPMHNIHLKNVVAEGGVSVETAYVDNLNMENVTFGR